MNTPTCRSIMFLCSVLLAGASWLLTSCAPGRLEQGMGISVQPEQMAGSSTNTVGPRGYPGPVEPTATAAAPAPTPQLPFAPPDPSAKVRVAAITEVDSLGPGTLTRYTIKWTGPTLDNPKEPFRVFVSDSLTGAVVQLGDDKGAVSFDTMTDRYVIWSYHCAVCDSAAAYKTGMYARVLETGKDMPLGLGSSPKVSGDWVAYLVDIEPGKVFALRVHNILSGEETEVTKNVVTGPGYGPTNYFVINEGHLAWIETDLSTREQTIRVLDLSDKSVQKLDVRLRFPLQVSVSRNLVIWRDTYWIGYDLSHKAMFNVPAPPMPAELREVPGFIYVTAQGDRVQWTLKFDGQKDRYFSASVLPATQLTP